MFTIDVPYFNLDQIYNSGQCPRWIKLGESSYVIPFRDKALKIMQQRDRFDWSIYRLIMSCSEDDFFDTWFHYFDLKTDCFMENVKIKRLGKKFKIIAERGKGIHVIRQDSFEVYVFMKLITFVGYQKAGILMNKIAYRYGIEHSQKIRGVGCITWYEWPTPELMLEKLNAEDCNNKVKRFLKKLCEAIVYDDYAYSHCDNELYKLIGKHDLTAFPLNGIEETLIKNFKCESDEFAELYLDKIENKGIVYMYILHHIMNTPKGV